jgi:hypothetical protein
MKKGSKSLSVDGGQNIETLVSQVKGGAKWILV